MEMHFIDNDIRQSRTHWTPGLPGIRGEECSDIGSDIQAVCVLGIDNYNVDRGLGKVPTNILPCSSEVCRSEDMREVAVDSVPCHCHVRGITIGGIELPARN